MFTSDEKKALTIKFWEELREKLTIAGKMKGRNIDWMNYPNKINHLYFRMEANPELVRFCIDIQFLDKGVREVFFEQFEEFKVLLTENMPNDLFWLKSYDHPNKRTIARIYSELKGVNIYDQNTWPSAHQFLQENFLTFDEFWQDFGEVFRNLK